MKEKDQMTDETLCAVNINKNQQNIYGRFDATYVTRNENNKLLKNTVTTIISTAATTTKK